jgi:hypothetical protein
VSKRLEDSLDAMDANSVDDDGKWRLSTPARADYAFWSSLLRGWVGRAVFAGCIAALTALIVWLYA